MKGMRSISARYENGALLPTKPLSLRPGESVILFIVQKADPSRWDLARIASAANEDKILAEAGLDDWAAELEKEDQA